MGLSAERGSGTVSNLFSLFICDIGMLQFCNSTTESPASVWPIKRVGFICTFVLGDGTGDTDANLSGTFPLVDLFEGVTGVEESSNSSARDRPRAISRASSSCCSCCITSILFKAEGDSISEESEGYKNGGSCLSMYTNR